MSATRGWRRSKAKLETFGVTTSHWRDATKIQLHFGISESPPSSVALSRRSRQAYARIRL
jgi:hypothetical protein